MTQLPTFTPYPTYADPKAAVAFLEAAFGFEVAVMVLGPDDDIVHAEMGLGDGRIGIGQAWGDTVRSPTELGGMSTCFLHVQLKGGLDAHCERARSAGARILAEPQTKPYGDRTYVAADYEGNLWSFGETVDVAARESWDRPGAVTRETA
jgi:uncharacterized glyoxalase superfamily protein PhnB